MLAWKAVSQRVRLIAAQPSRNRASLASLGALATPRRHRPKGPAARRGRWVLAALGCGTDNPSRRGERRRPQLQPPEPYSCGVAPGRERRLAETDRVPPGWLPVRLAG